MVGQEPESFCKKRSQNYSKVFFPARVLICRGGYFPPSVAVSQRRLKLEVKLLAYRPRGVSIGKIGDDLERWLERLLNFLANGRRYWANGKAVRWCVYTNL